MSIFCHLPKPLREQVHRSVVAGLTHGAVFLLEAYSPKQLQFGTGGPKQLELLMPLDEVKQELNGLTFELAQEIERDVIEGTYTPAERQLFKLSQENFNYDEPSLA